MSSAAAVDRAFRRLSPWLGAWAGKIHPARWSAAGLSPKTREALAKNRRGLAILSENAAWLVEAGIEVEAGTGAAGEIDDASDWRAQLPLWLAAAEDEAADWLAVDGTRLWRAGLRFGAVRFHERIRRLVLRDEVNAFVAEAGGELHRFALLGAPLFHRASTAGEMDADADADVFAPDADEAADLASGNAGRALATQLPKTAATALGALALDLPAGLSTRVRAQLPPEADHFWTRARGWATPRLSSWRGLMRRLIASSP